MANNHLGFYLLLLLKIATTFAIPPKTLKEACIGDIGFELQFNIYNDSCPEAEAIIFSWVENAVMEDSRMAASLLRLHFHDCFVNASRLRICLFFCHVLRILISNVIAFQVHAGL